MNKEKNYYKKYIIGFWILFCIPFIVLFSIFFLIITGRMGFMPRFEDLENPKSYLASELRSDDGKVLGYYYYQNRSRIDFKDLSPNIVKAIVAIEDIRFEKHSGIDMTGLGRVLIKTIMMGQSDAGGGSTITQQLAKNLFGRDTTTYKSRWKYKMHLGLIKFKEWVTAIRLEKNYTKKEILVMYLNTVFFGSNAYGIKSAAQTYFNTTPDSLKIEEAALLAGIVNAPTRYNPALNPGSARFRRNIVLGQMYKYSFISKKEFDSLTTLPIILKYRVNDQNEGLAPHFRESLRVMLTANKPVRKKYFSKERFYADSLEWETNPLYGWMHKNKKPDGSSYDIYKDGLKIYTTIDSRLQQYAEKAVSDHLRNVLQPAFFAEKRGCSYAPFSQELSREQADAIINHSIRSSERYRLLRLAGMSEDSIKKIFRKKIKMRVFTWQGERDTLFSPLDSIKYYKFFLRAGFLSIDPHTGYIKAYVGGPDYKYFKYDHVRMGKRQVGSTIKPFLYTLAMQEGFSPCYKVPNVPQTFQMGDTTWTPRNSGKSGYEGEMVTLKWGLANSVNSISAWLIKQFTPSAVVDIMKKMGISGNILSVPSLILGTPEISLYEMTAAYCTYANKGVYITPLMVTHIEDKTGSIISRFYPQKKEAISEQTAYLMLSLMQSVMNEGTGIRTRLTYNLHNQIAGKTGTTQNQSDGWFMGITPNLVSGAWVGGELRSIHFDGIAMGQGANMALPIWANYMLDVYRDTSVGIAQKDTFERPTNFSIQLNCKESQEQEIRTIQYLHENY